MNHLPFIVGAYAATLIGTIMLAAMSYGAMRRAEREADEMRRGR